jgi:hypothetical protein
VPHSSMFIMVWVGEVTRSGHLRLSSHTKFQARREHD